MLGVLLQHDQHVWQAGTLVMPSHDARSNTAHELTGTMSARKRIVPHATSAAFAPLDERRAMFFVSILLTSLCAAICLGTPETLFIYYGLQGNLFCEICMDQEGCCCRSEDADSIASAPIRGQINQQYSQEDAQQQEPSSRGNSTCASHQPGLFKFSPILTIHRQHILEDSALVASTVMRGAAAAEEGTMIASSGSKRETADSLQLSGDGWAISIRLHDSVSRCPLIGQPDVSVRSQPTLQQGLHQQNRDATGGQQSMHCKLPTVPTAMLAGRPDQRLGQTATDITQRDASDPGPEDGIDSSQGSMQSTAGTVQLSGDDRARPISNHAHHEAQQSPLTAKQKQQGRPAPASHDGADFQDSTNTMQLSGQGWAMPVKLHGLVAEGINLSASLLHKGDVVPPQQAGVGCKPPESRVPWNEPQNITALDPQEPSGKPQALTSADGM